ncbi:MAG: hypothetical protein WDM70_01535 [Nitrosomonadales bacterium]
MLIAWEDCGSDWHMASIFFLHQGLVQIGKRHEEYLHILSGLIGPCQIIFSQLGGKQKFLGATARHAYFFAFKIGY